MPLLQELVVFGSQYLLQHVFVGLGAVVLLNILLTRYKPGLRQIPGPFWASVTGLWRTRVSWRGDYHKVIRKLHDKYGPYVRIGPNVVSIGDPGVFSSIYGITGGYNKTDLLKSNMMVYKGRRLPNLFAITDESEHRALKRPIAHAYSTSAMIELEAHMDDCSGLLLKRLKEASQDGTEPLDMSKWLQYYAFDVIGEITFSKKFGFLQTGGDVADMLSTIDFAMVYQALIGHINGLHEILLGNPLLRFILPTNYITQFTLDRISEREKVEGHSPDLIGRLFAVKDADPARMPVEHILSHTTTNVFAGSDTTAISLRAIVYYLCKYPDVHKTLLAEIQEADRNGLLSPFVTFAEAQRLPYFQAVVREVLRHFPPTAIILERRVPEGGLQLGDVTLPVDTTVGMSAWILHYNKEIFGEDAEDFRVERWLEAEPEQRKQMEKYWFTFGSGSRTCIGKNVALMEINKVITQLVRHVDLSLADPKSSWTERALTVVKQSNLICNLKFRSN